MRKHLLDYDDVLNKHREVIYKKRKEFLAIADWRLKIEDLLKAPEEKKALEEKIKELGENFDQVAKFVALRTLDSLWMNHLEEMEALRDSVRLRAYGQQDPLVEYKAEGHKMFQRLLGMIESNIAQTILRVSVKPQPGITHLQRSPETRYRGEQRNVGRNDPCPCGAAHPDGRPLKYKHCHGKNV